MIYLYFIEIDGVKHYKTDIFWSTTKSQGYAKPYNTLQPTLLTVYGQGFKYWRTTKEEDYLKEYSKYNGALLGYSQFDDCIPNDESKPLNIDYLFIFNVNSEAEYTISDYKQENRNNQIDKILK